jgi:protein O-mannosyl-transferase
MQNTAQTSIAGGFTRAQAWGVAALLVCITWAALIGVAGNGFARYDDDDYIAANDHVMQGLTWEGAKWAFTSLHAANWHPLTWLSHMLDVSLFGMRAGWHHLMSLLLHTCSVLLLFWFLCRTTRRLWPSALVAAIFAVHPLHVESVAWAAERKDVLSAVFWFAAMLAWSFYADRPGLLRYAGVFLLLALGLLAKPMLVTLPLVLLMLDYWPLKRFTVDGSRWRLRLTGTSVWRLVLEKLPLLALAAASSAMTLKAQTAAIAGFESLGFGARLANAVVSYGRYIWAMIWPGGLAAFYPFATSMFAAKLICSVVLLLAFTAFAIAVARSRRYVIVGWLWYVVTLVPVIGIVQVGWQSHADRYTYITLVGLFCIVAWVLAEWLDTRPQFKGPVTACAAVVVVIMAAVTFRQVGFWKDDLAVCRRAVEVTRYNPAMLANLGAILGERGQVQEGLAALQEALKAMPDNARVLTATGSLLSRAGRHQDSLAYFDKAIRIQPRDPESQLGMATSLVRLGRVAEAESFCRTAVELKPDKGDSRVLLGIVLAQQGKMDDAMNEFHQAAEARPPVATARVNMARIYVQRGQLDMALDECRRSVAMQPHHLSYDYMGQVLVRMQRFQEAEQAYRLALRLNPAAAETHYNLAVLLEQQGRKTEAADEASKAASLDAGDKAYSEFLQRLKTGTP